MKTWDVVIIGGGVIGLSLAWRLRRDGASVLIVEKSEPAREATHAAAGMIAHCDPHNPPALAALIAASARMYPEFVRELREESFESPDLRSAGTIAFFAEDESPGCAGARAITDDELARIEPLVSLRGRSYLLPESSVDPRKLGSALEKTLATFRRGLRHRLARQRGGRAGRPRRRGAHREIFLRRRCRRELRRRVGLDDSTLRRAHSSGERTDGLRGAADRERIGRGR